MLSHSRFGVEEVKLGRHCRVKHDTADIGGKQVHDSERQACTVRDTIQVDLLVTKRMNQIMDIGGISNSCIGLEIDASICQTIMTCFCCLQAQLICLVAGEVLTY